MDWMQQFVRGSDMALFMGHVLLRLALAAILGGMIGLERELRHKSAGLRTNMLICVGAAFFTVLSINLATLYPGDHTRIASQILPGIGFIGAGSILHSRGSVQGLTTAATIFVVASIGMAVGGGFYLPAILAAAVVLSALVLLGWVEGHFVLKPLLVGYEIAGSAVDDLLAAINSILEDEHLGMQTVRVARANSHFRVHFTVDATRKEHAALLSRFRQISQAHSVESLGAFDHE